MAQGKVLFLVFHGFAEHNGISKKIHYQAEALRQNNYDVTLCYFNMDNNGNHSLVANDQTIHFYGNTIRAKILRRIDFKTIYKYIIENHFDWIYIRYNHNASPFFINFAKKLKRAGIPIMLEIPTFPYDKEYESLSIKEKIEHTIECLYRKRLSKYITRIVTFSNYEKIWNCRTVQISNGIDFNSIKVQNKIPHNGYNFIAIADISIWHGYDLAIKGLGEYYSQGGAESISLHIIGDGRQDVISNLHQLTQEYHLEDHVIFYGPMYGEQLDDIFNIGDMGIASLARHRSGITHIKTLKNREFAARGIPFVYSEIDEDFDSMPYVIKSPADESPLDIKVLIQFLKDHDFSASTIRQSIEHLSWKEQMHIVAKNIS